MTEETKRPELLPCPFCGGKVSLERTTAEYELVRGNEWWGVVCRNTLNLGGSCAIQQIPSASKDSAIKRWNRRAPTTPGERTAATQESTSGSGLDTPERLPASAAATPGEPVALPDLPMDKAIYIRATGVSYLRLAYAEELRAAATSRIAELTRKVEELEGCRAGLRQYALAIKRAAEPFCAIKAGDGDTFNGYAPETIIRCEILAGELQTLRMCVGYGDPTTGSAVDAAKEKPL